MASKYQHPDQEEGSGISPCSGDGDMRHKERARKQPGVTHFPRQVKMEGLSVSRDGIASEDADSGGFRLGRQVLFLLDVILSATTTTTTTAEGKARC